MKRASLLRGLSLAVLFVALPAPHAAKADPLVTWGGARAPTADATSVTRDSAVTRARDLLTRARFLDDAASTDERTATELAGRLPALRSAAKTARERADRATPEERIMLGAHAEDLEVDVLVSEAEVVFKRKIAVENRGTARELRVRAVQLVKDAPLLDATFVSATAAHEGCDPPYNFTTDGRKVYRLECLR